MPEKKRTYNHKDIIGTVIKPDDVILVPHTSSSWNASLKLAKVDWCTKNSVRFKLIGVEKPTAKYHDPTDVMVLEGPKITALLLKEWS